MRHSLPTTRLYDLLPPVQTASLRGLTSCEWLHPVWRLTILTAKREYAPLSTMWTIGVERYYFG